jgi:hypothetical protein
MKKILRLWIEDFFPEVKVIKIDLARAFEKGYFKASSGLL